jgi:hypothetical protein
MRIRQVKPSFWTDAVMAGLPYSARLFYIGLWGQADDAGWLRWDAYRIGCELYGGEPRKARERRIEAWRYELEGVERLVSHPCGHVEIPHLTKHQHLPAPDRRIHTEWRDHQKNCLAPQTTANNREEPRPPVTVSKGKREGYVKGSARERAGTQKTEFQEQVGPVEGVHQ